ncbi:unnamed protein product [Rangifer tarandus platyrhynchus]|uniref:Uncharacterized protein n=2 Tax=Rangifer tarandus platyrhynchus TaxID=3082113 RepID=A0ACB0EBQ8_RANTA|nr:unnamed protein product [Rangifer tarandus platyrhynchus]CAI9698006.1 unnamed protein product [Rangifer tarandus platyrhynchus]
MPSLPAAPGERRTRAARAPQLALRVPLGRSARRPSTRRSGPGRRRRGRSGPGQGAASRLRFHGRALGSDRGSACFSALWESA